MDFQAAQSESTGLVHHYYLPHLHDDEALNIDTNAIDISTI